MMKIIKVFYNYFFKSPYRFILRWLILKKSLEKASAFLKQGKFIVSIDYKSLIHESCQDEKKLNKNNPSFKRNIIIQILELLLNNTFKLENNPVARDAGMIGGGTVMIMSNKKHNQSNYSNFKVIDSESMRVFSFYNSKKSFQNHIDGCKYFGNFYNIPQYSIVSNDDFVIEEELIGFKHSKYFSSKDFENVFNSMTLSYSKQIDYVLSSKAYNLKRLEVLYKGSDNMVASFMSDVNDALYKISSIHKFPYFLQHGDLCLSNILLSTSGESYLIDWEHMCSYVFLYDLMWVWQNEAIHKGNYYYLNKYFLGNYDQYLSQLFDKFDLKYHKDYRINHFFIVIAELINRRIISFNNHNMTDSFIKNKLIPMINTLKDKYLK